MYMCGALCICAPAHVHNGKRDQAGGEVVYYAHVSDSIGACIYECICKDNLLKRG